MFYETIRQIKTIYIYLVLLSKLRSRDKFVKNGVSHAKSSFSELGKWSVLLWIKNCLLEHILRVFGVDATAHLQLLSSSLSMSIDYSRAYLHLVAPDRVVVVKHHRRVVFQFDVPSPCVATLKMQRQCKATSAIRDVSKNQTPPTLLSSLRSVLFVIGTVVIGFAAFCNSLTWHLQRFWGASGDFWQAQWDKILDKFGDNPVTLWVYGSLTLTIIVYWLVGGIYTILDITNRPAALRRYKIQPGTNEPVDNRKLCKVIAQVLFNQIVVGFPIMYLGYYFMEWRGYSPVRKLPTFHWVLAEIAIHILCEEIGFYYSHRFLHKGSLYKYIHKQHHEWTAPIAVTALYCHPLEHIGSNLLPPFLGVFIMGSHVATAWIWFSLAILSTLNAHSGYHLPFFPSPEAHDFHHLKFNQCYGVLGVLDRIHGTDTQFRSSRNYARHVMMLSLVPPREAFPDEAKYKSK